MYRVRCLETDTDYYFVARTAYESLQKMLYTLNANSLDKSAVINKTISGYHLYLTHCGNTYVVRN